MDDESGESMEPMEEVPLIQLGEAELERLVRGLRRGNTQTETDHNIPSVAIGRIHAKHALRPNNGGVIHRQRRHEAR